MRHPQFSNSNTDSSNEVGIFLIKSLLLPPRTVKRLVYFTQLLVGEVCVDLRGGDVCMAKELLHRAQVGAIHEEVGGETVAE